MKILIALLVVIMTVNTGYWGLSSRFSGGSFEDGLMNGLIVSFGCLIPSLIMHVISRSPA